MLRETDRNHTFVIGVTDELNELRRLPFSLLKSVEASLNPLRCWLLGFDECYKAILVVNSKKIIITIEICYAIFRRKESKAGKVLTSIAMGGSNELDIVHFVDDMVCHGRANRTRR